MCRGVARPEDGMTGHDTDRARWAREPAALLRWGRSAGWSAALDRCVPCDSRLIQATLYLTLPEKSMADVEQFKDDLENNADGLIGGSRGDFMEALGEAVYAQIAGDQLNRIVAAYLTLQEVVEANVDSPDDEASKAIDRATDEFNEMVGRILGFNGA